MNHKKENWVMYGMVVVVLILSFFLSSSQNSLQGKQIGGVVTCPNGIPISQYPDRICPCEDGKKPLPGKPCPEDIRCNTDVDCPQNYECCTRGKTCYDENALSYDIFSRNNRCIRVQPCQLMYGDGDERRLDIVFIPDKYTTDIEKTEFRTKTAAATDAIINTEPFKTEFKKYLNIWRLERFDIPLDCKAAAHGGINCDIFQIPIGQGCRMDKQVILVHSQQILRSSAESRYDYTAVYGSDPHFSSVVVHELGHIFGLDDEYVEDESTTPHVRVRPGPNCDNKQPCKWERLKDKELSEWKDVTEYTEVQRLTCEPGCTYSSWFRSSAGGDIMKDQDRNNFFGVVSREHIKLILKRNYG